MKSTVRSLPKLLAIAALLAFSGCGGKEHAPSSAVDSATEGMSISLPEIPAADYLKRVLTRYQNTRSYRDRGEVRLRVEKDGQLVRRTAPMQVVMDGPTIWIAAYDARVWSDPERMIGWIADEQTDFHDGQVLLAGPAADGPSASRPALEKLLRDPILTARMVSGLGGPPPQLEWLLDPNPMGKLFGHSTRPGESAGQEGTDQNAGESEQRSIRYEGMARRENVQCVIVETVAGDDVYRFWIDPQRSLIHCVELPVAMAGKRIELEGWQVRSLELVLTGASFQPPESPYRMEEMPESDLPRRPSYLRSLVPLPPPPPDRRLGRQVAAFQVVDRTGRVKVTERGVGRPLTLWYAGLAQSIDGADAKNMHAAEVLSVWLRQTPESIRDQVSPVAVVSDSTGRLFADAGLANGFWVVLAQRSDNGTRNLDLEPGRAMLVDSRGTVIWVGDPFSPADIVSLSAIVQDRIAGVDVARAIHQQWEADRDAYQTKLDELQIR
ncbi:hypothetical protein NZK35_07440 [Stieleria sp. ICT_E10.1]|uniref:hypothetical protein n=1 Tax=Stieleria sedimenti TaxID=2976331 RepID=UPI00217F9349|nr:hypothetical protein [Stieleria sedimenti]MCS7466472.1 hypothetical protein [Stieleria sedimenti]